jgi:AcrR family transcriptional regulator
MLVAMPETSRVGRWRTGQLNKQRIIEVARERFTRDGYDRTTARAIATDAGVDVAMVYYFFDSKDGLFTASTLAARQHPLQGLTTLLDAATENIGARLVRHYLEQGHEGVFDPLLTPGHATSTQSLARQMSRETLTGELAERIAGKFGVTNAKLRIELVAAQLAGLAFARYRLKTEPIASTPIDELVSWIGPTVQRYLTDPNADLGR